MERQRNRLPGGKVIRMQLIRALCVVAWLLGLQISAYACNVPVFRYAIERWPVSPYQAVIVARAPLTASEAAGLSLLEKATTPAKGILNLSILRFTPNELAKTDLAERLPRHDTRGARLHLLFPVSADISAPIWSGPLTEKTSKAIIDSRFRRALVRKILEGNSGVFILLESGNKARDNAAAKALDGHLARLSATLRVPGGVVDADGAVTGGAPSDGDPINQLRSTIPLKIAFTSVRLPRKGVDDILVATLTNLEPDLGASSDQPMVFAVYGRGRALVPLIGRGITPENVEDIASFLVGPCSCQIKALNPGVDLLLSHDWDRSVLGEDEP